MSEQEQVAEVSEEIAPSDDWRESLPQEISADPSIQHIGSVEAMAKSYINAQKMVGADKVAIPGNWATDEDWEQVYSKFGRPDQPSDYELELGDGSNEEFTNWFRDAAHSAGLSERQAQRLATQYEEFAGGQVEVSEASLEQHRSEVETSLRKEYGKDFDTKMETANQLLTEFDAPDLTEIRLADGTLLGDNPDLVKFMVSIADYIDTEISEDGLAGRESTPGITDQNLQDQIMGLTAKNSPYWEKQHPDHTRIVNQVLHLRGQLHGE
mgnify:CR=1 FL=1